MLGGNLWQARMDVRRAVPRPTPVVRVMTADRDERAWGRKMSDKDLTRIAALLRKAEGTDNEHEADAYLQAAQ